MPIFEGTSTELIGEGVWSCPALVEYLGLVFQARD